MTRPVPLGWGRADGGRAVVTVCDGQLARGWWGSGEGVGPVGCGANGRAGGLFEVVRVAGGGLADCDVVTELSQVARNMVGPRGIR
jgi:hypothetical protein